MHKNPMFALVLFACAATAHAELVELNEGHMDVDLAWQGPGTPWRSSLHADQNDPIGTWSTDDAYVYAGESARSTLPALPSSFDFLGASVGQTIWVLPQTPEPGLPYLGWSGEHGLSRDLFHAYDTTEESKGRFEDSFEAVKVRLTGFTGEGSFLMWDFPAFSDPRVLLSTYDDGSANPDANGFDATDGIGADDFLYVYPGSHSHYNWAFTASGVHRLTFEASGYLKDGTAVSSGPFAVTFGIEAKPVPEPASLAALGLGAFALMRRRSRV